MFNWWWLRTRGALGGTRACAQRGGPTQASPRTAPRAPGCIAARRGAPRGDVRGSSSARARVGVRARAHGARTHGGARSPRPDYRRGLRIPGSRRILLNSFEKRGIFVPQVRGNTAEISENSESIRSMRIAVQVSSCAPRPAAMRRARGVARPRA